MEPPGGQPPDRDRQAVFKTQTPTIQTSTTSGAPMLQQQQLVPFQQPSKPDQLTLNLSAQQQQLQKQSAVSPAITIFPVPSAKGSSAAGTSPALASTATAFSATTQAATAFSGSSVGHGHLLQHHHRGSQQHAVSPLPQHNPVGAIALLGGLTGGITGSSTNSAHPTQSQQPIEKLSRPMAFDKMESLVREMQDPEHGVPVRQQKMFLTSIPYAFMGYDLIEWLMDRLLIEESEALNIANQLCLHGYFFPVNDTKTLAVKDDSSLYRFQTPYYWPWQHKAPDNVEYAIYLAKRSLRNKQRHALEDYEAEALASLHKNLKGKWDFISMQAEEQVRLAKERKKGDKIVGDSQERAYWRVHRPPPGQFTPLEPCPVPSRDRQGAKPNKKKSIEDVQRELDYLKKSLNRTRMKMSQACESLVNYSETFIEYDFFLQPVLPSNPWVTEDVTFWQLNNTFVDVPTEKRVKRWAISIEELVCDPTGLQEFTAFLEKEYSHENIRFWIAVNRLRRSAHSQVPRKVNEIYEEFLKPGAPCEINIDGKTMESVLRGLKHPSRFTFDAASEHIYMLLLKKDCYPRFIRSEHYKRLLESGIQPSHKKRFFNFGGVSGAKKKMTAALSSQPNLGDGMKQGSGSSAAMMQAPPPGSLARRRGSDRSLTGSAHELAVIGVNKDVNTKVPHSHSQSNLSEIPYRDPPKLKGGRLETTIETSNLSTVCPWDEPPTTQAPVPTTQVQLSVCPWEQDTETDLATQVKGGTTRLTSTSSDNSEVSDRIQRNLGIRHQNTVDSGDTGKRLMPNFTEQRRASMSFTPSRITEYQFGRPAKPTTTPSPTIGSQTAMASGPFSLFATGAVAVATINSAKSSISKDPPSTASETDVEEELKQLILAERKSESSPSELPVVATPVPTPTPPPLTKITPPPEDAVVRENSPTPIVESDFGSASEESAGPAEAIVSSGAGSDVDDIEGNVIQEVQIELIEATEAPQSPLVLKQTSTPTIHVEDETGADPTTAPNKLSLMSMNKLKTPINSAPSSPDKQLEVIITSDLATSDLAIELNPLPSPPVVVAKMETSPQHTSTLEEDVQMMKDNESYFGQEELSPTTDEYQEGLRFVSDTKDAYSYDIVDTDESTGGYIPPAPTPAPSIAPLAEMDIDTVDDEFCDIEEAKSSIQQTAVVENETKQAQCQPLPALSATSATAGSEEVKKKRKKRNSDPKRMASLEEKEKATTSSNAKATEADRNAVCPWEDETVTPSDGTFVKTYATLGYL